MRLRSLRGRRGRGWRIAFAAMAIAGLAAAARAQSAGATLRISPETAVSLALANNLDLESARRSPAMADLDVSAARSAWSPSLLATLGQRHAESPANTALDGGLRVLTDRELSSDLSVSQLLPWGGSYEVGWSSVRRANNSLLNRFQPETNAAATATITQPLLRDLAIDRARAAHARSVYARDRAGFELAGAVAGLKREVLYAYWRWVYARDLRGVASEALALARTLLEGNRERVAARAMAATDVIEAEAEVARRDEAVIVAEKNVANTEDALRLLIFNARHPDYRTPIEPAAAASAEAAAGAADDSDDPVAHALAARSDISILKSVIASDSLDVREFRNNALPDVSVSAGVSSRAVGGTELIHEGGLGTPIVGSLDRGFGLLLGDLGRLRYPGWSMQVTLGYPLGAVAAKANAARAELARRQTELSLAAVEERVATEVRTAQREVETNDKRLQSTATAVALAERRLAAEEEKFLVGLSTSFFVFQAQRDLASARVARLGAVLDRRLSAADLEAVQSAPLAPLR